MRATIRLRYDLLAVSTATGGLLPGVDLNRSADLEAVMDDAGLPEDLPG